MKRRGIARPIATIWPEPCNNGWMDRSAVTGLECAQGTMYQLGGSLEHPEESTLG